MVVNAQVKGKTLERVRQHILRCHVHGDHKIPRFCHILGQTLMQMGIFGGDFRIFQDVGVFAQLPQTHAQQRGGT